MNIITAYYSAIGGREKNEDALSLTERDTGVIAVVADGLGGFLNGEIASDTAVKEINLQLSGQSVSRERLSQAIQMANQKIYQQNHRQISRMLTTIAVLWMNDASAFAANVGDTRIYQIREGQIVFQTEDHSVAGMAAALGEIDASQIRIHPDRNKLIRAVGAGETVTADLTALQLESGDVLILCSDGFWEYVDEQEMITGLFTYDSVKIWLEQMKKIISERNHDDGDNNSCIIIKIL